MDVETGARDNAVPFKVIQKFRSVDPNQRFKPMVGCNSVPGGSGILRVGDIVAVTNAL